MRDAGLSIKAWLDINDNDYAKSKEVLDGYVKWVGIVQHKSDPNDIDVRIGKYNSGLLGLANSAGSFDALYPQVIGFVH